MLMTSMIDLDCCNSPYRLRYWNLLTFADGNTDSISVATALTVYGIETPLVSFFSEITYKLQQPLPFTVLKLIKHDLEGCGSWYAGVATALTVYGIETCPSGRTKTSSSSVLQQPLPFTVLKRGMYYALRNNSVALQQPLPFTVLKLFFSCCICSL